VLESLSKALQYLSILADSFPAGQSKTQRHSCTIVETVDGHHLFVWMWCSAKCPVNEYDLALSQEPDVRVCGEHQYAPRVISVQQMTLVVPRGCPIVGNDDISQLSRNFWKGCVSFSVSRRLIC